MQSPAPIQSQFLRPHYRQGQCDVLALALYRLTGLPLGIWAGWHWEDGEKVYENVHAVLILPTQVGGVARTLDVDGVHSGQPSNLVFFDAVDGVELLEVTEGDMRVAFTCEDISDDAIAQAENVATELGLLRWV